MKMLNIVCVVIVVFSLTKVAAYAQSITNNSIYPFTEGNRDDSLKVVISRINALLDSRKFYEKTYLEKKLIFLPVESEINVFSSIKPYARLNDIPNGKFKKYFKHYHCKAHATLKRLIKEQNLEINKKNEITKKDPRGSTTEQQNSVLPLKKIDDYELIFVPEKLFVKIYSNEPDKNKIIDSLDSHLDQILLGRPRNLDGFVNSINYKSPNLDQDSVPELIENLLNENLNLCKSLITNKEASAMISDVKINYKKLRGSNKLWAYTNIPNKTIYISPYLIRAVYNITLYKGKLFKLAELNSGRHSDLGGFLRTKGGSSVSQIDTAYFSNFVDLFTKNLSFIIGHELAHIYLSGKEMNIDIESACDLYSAYYFLKRFDKLELGVFEDFLAKSVLSNEIVFWGDNISKDKLTDRYKELVNLKSKNNVNIIIDKLHPQDN